MRNLNVLYLAAASCMWLLSSVAGHSVSAVAEPASSQYTDVVNALQTTKPVRLSLAMRKRECGLPATVTSLNGPNRDFPKWRRQCAPVAAVLWNMAMCSSCS